MSKTYRPYDPDQQLLLSAALREWLPDDHLAYFISDVVDQLDLSEITARCERESRGGPPYHPRMMVKVLYGYCVGVASSRRIAQRLHEDIAFRVLAANNTPDFRTISDFRKDNLEALSGLFLQVLALCRRAGLVKLGHVALDGTKVRANASRHKAMSYGRMKEKEAQLAGEVEELLRRAQEVDDEEDRRYGQSKRGDELPQELAFREGRLRKIREVMAALEAESQAVVDSAHQVIVAAQATNQTSDKQQAVAMVEEAIDNVGAVPKEVSADAGYYSAQAVDGLYRLCVNPFVAPERTRHGTGCAARAPGSHTQSSVYQGSDAPEAADQTGSATLRSADANGGAGIRPDQAGPRLPPVPAAGPGEGQRRVIADLHRPQPAQAVPLWGGSASRNTDQQICRKCPEHRRGGRHSEAYETIGPSVAAPGNNSCRRLTSPVPKARQSILRRAASGAIRALTHEPPYRCPTRVAGGPSRTVGRSYMGVHMHHP